MCPHKYTDVVVIEPSLRVTWLHYNCTVIALATLSVIRVLQAAVLLNQTLSGVFTPEKRES